MISRTARHMAVAMIALATAACGAPAPTRSDASPAVGGPTGSSASATPPSSHVGATPAPSPVTGSYTLGHFPDAPTAAVPAPMANTFQVVLDAAVEHGLPGISATVITADGGVWTGAAGTADGVHPVEARSQFAIASITKTVIAAEIMRLSEAGLLRLTDPVSVHLPTDFHFDTNGATIENLLGMQSGITDPALSEDSPEVLADPLREWTAREVLGSVPVYRSAPGDHFVYEDANYMLLGLVIEQTTGLSVAAALRAHILADPRLTSMVYQPEERPEGPLALPIVGGQVRPNIVQSGGGYLPSRSEASDGSGSGGMASDSAALALWGYLLFGGRLLSEDSLLAMTTDLHDGWYGLGVINQTHRAGDFGVDTFGNGGWDTGGYASVLSVQPSRGIAISVMTNMQGDPLQLVFPVAQALASAVHR